MLLLIVSSYVKVSEFLPFSIGKEKTTDIITSISLKNCTRKVFKTILERSLVREHRWELKSYLYSIKTILFLHTQPRWGQRHRLARRHGNFQAREASLGEDDERWWRIRILHENGTGRRRILNFVTVSWAVKEVEETQQYTWVSSLYSRIQ